MNYVKIRFKVLLILVIICFLLIVVFVDNDSLNSLVINNDNDNFFDDVNVLTVDYNKVVYANTNVNSNSNSSNNSNSNSSNNSVKTVNNVAKSNWVWPTGANYVITTYYSSWHKAIDIAGPGNGSSIYAANNGVVSSVQGGCIPGNLSCNGRGGNYIVINHNNGYYTVYMHLKSINVNVGQSVSAGQVIATMGNTGNVVPAPANSSSVSGTHLHFCLYKGEPYKGGYEVNPMSLY